MSKMVVWGNHYKNQEGKLEEDCKSGGFKGLKDCEKRCPNKCATYKINKLNYENKIREQ